MANAKADNQKANDEIVRVKDELQEEKRLRMVATQELQQANQQLKDLGSDMEEAKKAAHDAQVEMRDKLPGFVKDVERFVMNYLSTHPPYDGTTDESLKLLKLALSNYNKSIIKAEKISNQLAIHASSSVTPSCSTSEKGVQVNQGDFLPLGRTVDVVQQGIPTQVVIPKDDQVPNVTGLVLEDESKKDASLALIPLPPASPLIPENKEEGPKE